jgi:hypothetical protein
MSNQPELTLIHQGSCKKIIIFVHGLWGDPKTSFASWPNLIAEDDEKMRAGPVLSSYSVATLGYPAGMNDCLSITEVKTRLLKELEDRGIFDDYEEIFFICHSLGGLVIKGIFIDLNMEYPQYLQKIAAIFLISTPSQGAPAANFLSLLHRVVGKLVLDLRTIDDNTFLQHLENQWQAILRQRENKYPPILGAYEKKATSKILKVVPDAYTATYYDDTPIAVNCDHIDIVKPNSTNDSIYKWVRGRIADLQIKREQQQALTEKKNILALKKKLV